MIPLVVASEVGIAQTVRVAMHWRGSRSTLWYPNAEWKHLESCTSAGDSPVHECRRGLVLS